MLVDGPKKLVANSTISEMFLNEIFDTKIEVAWSKSSTSRVGKFQLDSADYEIQLDELQIHLPSGDYSVLDVGFTSDGSHVTTDKFNSAKVFGAIFNSIPEQIAEINPDVILFGAHNKNGSVESRKSLYAKLASWFSRGSDYQYCSDWLVSKNGSYKFLAKSKPTGEDLEFLQKFVESIPQK